jgi:hypothetical protein
VARRSLGADESNDQIKNFIFKISAVELEEDLRMNISFSKSSENRNMCQDFVFRITRWNLVLKFDETEMSNEDNCSIVVSTSLISHFTFHISGNVSLKLGNPGNMKEIIQFSRTFNALILGTFLKNVLVQTAKN